MTFKYTLISTITATLTLAGIGCSSLKSLRSSDKETASTNPLMQFGDASQNVSEINPTQQKVSLLLAKASLAELDNRRSGAVRCYESLLEIDPNQATAHHRLAILYVQQENPKDADIHFKRAIQLASDNPIVQNDYGYFCHLRDDAAGAEKHLRRALELDPDYLAAHNNLGLVLAGEGRVSEAQVHFELAQCGRAESLNNLAFARFLKSDIDGASALFRQALHIDPNQRKSQATLESLRRISERPDLNLDFDTYSPVIQASQSVDASRALSAFP